MVFAIIFVTITKIELFDITLIYQTYKESENIN